MNSSINNYILSKLQQRKDENNFRSLKLTGGLTDFYSNDYLGFARNKKLKQKIAEELSKHEKSKTGSTGSRLLSGNTEYAQQLERYLADYHRAEDALVFNSGFDANYGLLATLPYKGDTIICDELVHASIHDGMRASKANGKIFRHNNLEHLEEQLQSSIGLKYVVVESIYSMDGDFAPLKKIVALCEKYDAGLVVDEAHATGIIGQKGEGRVAHEGLEKKVLARIHTFGKAIGANGATILCSNEAKEFLVNYCRPFIFSTALPFHSLVTVKSAYEFLNEVVEERSHLFNLIEIFRSEIQTKKIFQLVASETPIQSIIISGNQNVKLFAEKLLKQGFDVRPILFPTVPKGKERIRICLHSFNSAEEVIKLAHAINAAV